MSVIVGRALPDVRDGGRFALSHLVTADSADGLEREFAAARSRRNEGLMVKDPASPYSPGRRGLGWLKMKKALATLDCVVIGVEGPLRVCREGPVFAFDEIAWEQPA